MSDTTSQTSYRAWWDLVNGVKEGTSYDICRAGLSVLSRLYDAALELYLLQESVGLRSRSRLPCLVVSVGNLSVGGTGKTPMVRHIAANLQAKGFRVSVLSRGFGSKHRGAFALISDDCANLLAHARRAGDEAFWLANSLPGVPVAVGKDRRISGRKVVERFRPDVILLDDGFQYWQLVRDLDVVLVDAAAPFGNGRTLPRGPLREVPGHLERARAVVVTRSDRMTRLDKERLRRQLHSLSPSAGIYYARHRASGWLALNNKAVDHVPGRCLPFCAIAKPESFLSSAEEAGASIAGEIMTYPDHHAYTASDIDAIVRAAHETSAESVITTEKDAVKLDAALFDLPLYALRIEMEIENQCRFWQMIENLLVRKR